MSSLNSLQRGIRQRARRQRQEAQRTWRKRVTRLRTDTHPTGGGRPGAAPHAAPGGTTAHPGA